MKEKSFAEWDDKFDTGIDFVDEQHRGLIRIMNELHDGLKKSSAQKRSDAFCQAAHKAVEYVMEHFAAEEEWMRNTKYSGYERQKKEHSKFIARLLEHCEKFSDYDMKNALDFAHFLRYWLFTHIANEDKKFKVQQKESDAPKEEAEKTEESPAEKDTPK